MSPHPEVEDACAMSRLELWVNKSVQATNWLTTVRNICIQSEENRVTAPGQARRRVGR